MLCCGDLLFGAALEALLVQHPDLTVVETLPGPAGLTDAVQHHLPDVVLVARCELEPAQVRSASKLAKVVIITADNEPHEVWLTLSLGVRAFLTERSTPDEVLGAVRTIAAGSSIILPLAAGRDRVPGVAWRSINGSPELALLTPREREVLQLMASGLSNSSIAKKLFVTPATVRSHVHRVLAKLGVRSRVQAVSWAYQTCLVDGLDDGGGVSLSEPERGRAVQSGMRR